MKKFDKSKRQAIAMFFVAATLFAGSATYFFVQTQPKLLRTLREIYYERIGTYDSEGENNDEALVDDSKATEISCTTEVYKKQAATYFERGDVANALGSMDEAIECDPADSESYHFRGRYHWYLGNETEALWDLGFALELDNQYVEAHNLRSLVYATAGRYEKALEEVNMALDSQPTDAPFLDTRGYVYLKSGRYHEAKADFEEIFRQDLRFPYALLGAGLTYQALGENLKARELLEEGLQSIEEYEVEYPDPQLADLMTMAEQVLEK